MMLHQPVVCGATTGCFGANDIEVKIDIRVRSFSIGDSPGKVDRMRAIKKDYWGKWCASRDGGRQYAGDGNYLDQDFRSLSVLLGSS